MSTKNYQETTGAPPMPPVASAAPSNGNCQSQLNPIRKPPNVEREQLADPIESTVSTLSKATVTRVLAKLRDGDSEFWITQKEHVTLAQVRAIRKAYFALIPRGLATFRMLVTNADELLTELERDVLEEGVA